MPTLNQVRTKANNKLTTFWGALQTRQDAYFAKHGKYFQLLAGSYLTLDGDDTLFTVISPEGEQHTEDIDYSWSDTVPFRIEVHEWIGDDRGYLAICYINHEGTIYKRTRDSNANDSGWSLYNPDSQ